MAFNSWTSISLDKPDQNLLLQLIVKFKENNHDQNNTVCVFHNGIELKSIMERH